MNKLNPYQKSVEVATTPVPAVSFAMPDAVSASDNAMEKALVYAAGKLNVASTDQVTQRLRQGNRDAVQYMSYGLATQIAQTLGTLDETVQAVYLFEDYATPDDLAFAEHVPMTVNLIARVERKTKAFDSLAQALSRALATSYGELVAASGPRHVLNIHPVDAADIANRSGYGALVTSLHYQPIQVWQR